MLGLLDNSNLTHYNITADDYDTYDFSEPWTDLDLSYPTEYDLEDDLAFLEEEEDDYKEEQEEEELEDIELMEKEKEEAMAVVGDDSEEMEDGSGILSLYDDDETTVVEEEEYYNALEELQEDDLETLPENTNQIDSNNMADDSHRTYREVEDLGGWEICLLTAWYTNAFFSLGCNVLFALYLFWFHIYIYFLSVSYFI